MVWLDPMNGCALEIKWFDSIEDSFAEIDAIALEKFKDSTIGGWRIAVEELTGGLSASGEAFVIG